MKNELKDIISLLGEDVATEDFTKALEKSFNETLDERVKDEVSKIVAEKIDVEVAEKTAKIKEELEEKNITEQTAYKEELVQDLTSYLEDFVKDFVKSKEENMNEELKVLKANAILESFSALGIEIKTINEDDRIQEREAEVKELKEKVDGLVNEKISLEKEVLSLSQGAIFEALSKDMTDVDKEKFRKLAESFISESDLETFKNKLELLKSSILEKDGDDDDDDDDDKKKKKKGLKNKDGDDDGDDDDDDANESSKKLKYDFSDFI